MSENYIRDGGGGGHKVDGEEARDNGDDDGDGEVDGYFAWSEV